MWQRAGGLQRECGTVVEALPNAGQTVIPNGKKVKVFEGTSKDGDWKFYEGLDKKRVLNP